MQPRLEQQHVFILVEAAAAERSCQAALQGPFFLTACAYPCHGPLHGADCLRNKCSDEGRLQQGRRAAQAGALFAYQRPGSGLVCEDLKCGDRIVLNMQCAKTPGHKRPSRHF